MKVVSKKPCSSKPAETSKWGSQYTEWNISVLETKWDVLGLTNRSIHHCAESTFLDSLASTDSQKQETLRLHISKCLLMKKNLLRKILRITFLFYY